MASNSSRLRSTGVSVLLTIVFVLIGALLIGALEKSQFCDTARSVAELQKCKNENLFIPSNLLHYDWQFIQSLWNALIFGKDSAGVPFHTYFLTGLGLTIEFCFISMPLAIVLGMLLALMSRSKFDILRIPTRSFVEFFRNTPLLVQLFAIYFGLNFVSHTFVNSFTVGVAALVLNYGAYECENLRAGIEAIDRGQGEAAATLGFGRIQTLRLIEIPQMIPIVLPPIINDLIYMYKDSSILSVISVVELTAQTQILARQHAAFQWQFYFIGGGIYLLLSLPLGRLARVVEGRVKSLQFNTKIDTTIVAVEVLVGSVILGLIAGILVAGISPVDIGSSLGNVLAAVGLAALLTAAVTLVLGLIVYLASRLLRVVFRRNAGGGSKSYRPGNGDDGDAGSDVDVAAAVPSSGL